MFKAQKQKGKKEMYICVSTLVYLFEFGGDAVLFIVYVTFIELFILS